MTFVMNAQSGETISFFYDADNEVFTIRQWHDDEDAPEGRVEHFVTISAHMLAKMAEEAGIAEVEYLEDNEED